MWHQTLIVYGLLAYCGIVSSQTVPKSFDCPMRELALEFAQNIQPWLSKNQLQEIADALNGAEEAQNCNVSLSKKILQNANKYAAHHSPIWNDLIEPNYDTKTVMIYVDYNHGNDNNDGSINKPIKHLNSALNTLRKLYGANYRNIFKKIILRKGKHYIPNTIYFNSNDSNLLITNYNNENVIISAALPLNCAWKMYKNGTNGLNYYQCQIPTNSNITKVKGLRVNGIRAIRARYPNGNPEFFPCGFCSTLLASYWLPPTIPARPVKTYNPSTPSRSDGISWKTYNIGVGGNCQYFVPNANLWCNAGTSSYTIPSGLRFLKSILPNSPYANTSGGIIQAWRPNHAGSWMFEIADYDEIDEIFVFGKGGFQEARGKNVGGEFFVENIYEELDYPTEWFYNETERRIYFYNNNTNGINGLQFEVTNLQVVFNYTGESMKNPVKNVEIRGLTISDTEYTYLEAHSAPSGGDFALERIGAIYLDNTENIMISNNLFTRLDGNGISINRYNRNVTIYKNEMTLIGSNAITLWGDTMNLTAPWYNDTGDYGMTSMGYDGTSGNQPRMINVVSNYVHELGISEKQSAFYFQTKSCSNYVFGNIFYNSPRTGITFNDGFGGNSTLEKNLVFNTCRESGDCGPFHSWDRQVYVTKIKSGTASTTKAYDHIISNFIIANYQSRWAIDTDDGSCYFNVTGNFLVYSESGLKSYGGGHDIAHYNNIYGYIQGSTSTAGNAAACLYNVADQLVGHVDKFYNNTCIINQQAPIEYANFHCNEAQNTWPYLDNNIVYIQSNDVSKTGACGLNEKAFQAKYNVDLKTVILPGPPDNKAIIQDAKQLLAI